MDFKKPGTCANGFIIVDKLEKHNSKRSGFSSNQGGADDEWRKNDKFNIMFFKCIDYEPWIYSYEFYELV